jgi:hypothetical protein
MACPGSVRLAADAPATSSVYAAEGTAAHALAKLALDRELPCSTWIDTEIEGFPVTEEMAEAVQLYVEAVRAQMERDPLARLYTEQKFSLASLNPPAPMFGTADAIVVLPSKREIVVADLKYGKGVLVEVLDNPQTQFYLLGALLEMERVNVLRGVRNVRAVIVQPRAFHRDGAVRERTYSYDEVLEFAADLLERARAATAPDAPLVAGDHCRFCPAAGSCPAIKTRALAVARVEFEEIVAPGPPAPATLPLDVLGSILDKVDILEDWIAALRARAATELERGQPVPGWKLVPKRAVRKWTNANALLAWAQERGVNPNELMTRPEPVSVAAAERLLKPLKIPLPDDLWTKLSSGTTLAPDHDPRPAAALGPAHDFTSEGDATT